SSAHGVLVELKEVAKEVASHETQVASNQADRARANAPALATRYALGDLELISLFDGFFRLDGGAMFGTVPKTTWTDRMPADDRNRVHLALRPLIVRGTRTMLIDAGLGDKRDPRLDAVYGLD